MDFGNSRPQTASDLIKDGTFSNAWSKVGDTSNVDSIAVGFGENVIKEVLDIVAQHSPELVHVFTHSADKAANESKRGTFTNRGGYHSALSYSVPSHTAPYYEILVPVPFLRGFAALKTETVVTKGINARFPYIKKVDLINDDWKTVVSNFKLGVTAPA